MSDTAKQKNPNSLLIAFRKYHTWLGLAMTAFIVIVALTGIYLNHKELFKGWMGKPGPAKTEKEPKERPKQSQPRTEESDGLTTATDLEALPVTFAQALAVCRERLGDEPVERIELKNEKGRLVYKIKAASGELVVDAGSGEASAKKKPEGKDKKPEDRGISAVVRTKAEYEEEQKGGMDWGKLIKDLHTGKVGGLMGKLLVDLTALVLVVLSLTGVYLWLIPVLRKRRSARQRATLAMAAGSDRTGTNRPHLAHNNAAGEVAAPVG